MSENKVAKSIKDIVESQQSEILKALPKHMNAGRFLRCVITQLKLTPKLQQCTWQSVVGAIFTMAQIGLEPVGGQAYLIPFGKECVLVVGYQGYKDLFYRHEDALSISMQTVFKGDDFHYSYGTDEYLNHIPKFKTETPTHHYAIAKIKGGGSLFVVWPHDKCVSHGRKHSKSFNSKSSPWQTDLNSMCRKTMLLQLKKVIPLSYEMRRVFEADESIRKFKPGTTDFIDLPNEAWTTEESEIKENQFPEGPNYEETKTQEPEKKKAGRPPKQKQETLFDEKPKTEKNDFDYNAVQELFDNIYDSLGQEADQWLKDAGYPDKNSVLNQNSFDDLTKKFEIYMERG